MLQFTKDGLWVTSNFLRNKLLYLTNCCSAANPWRKLATCVTLLISAKSNNWFAAD
jgi:hypothetical protein